MPCQTKKVPKQKKENTGIKILKEEVFEPVTSDKAHRLRIHK